MLKASVRIVAGRATRIVARECRFSVTLFLARRRDHQFADAAGGDCGALSEPCEGMIVPRVLGSPLRFTQITTSAPSARARLTGIGFTRAPSINRRPPELTGSNTPGRA